MQLVAFKDEKGNLLVTWQDEPKTPTPGVPYLIDGEVYFSNGRAASALIGNVVIVGEQEGKREVKDENATTLYAALFPVVEIVKGESRATRDAGVPTRHSSGFKKMIVPYS